MPELSTRAAAGETHLLADVEILEGGSIKLFFIQCQMLLELGATLEWRRRGQYRRLKTKLCIEDEARGAFKHTNDMSYISLTLYALPILELDTQNG